MLGWNGLNFSIAANHCYKKQNIIALWLTVEFLLEMIVHANSSDHRQYYTNAYAFTKEQPAYVALIWFEGYIFVV